MVSVVSKPTILASSGDDATAARIMQTAIAEFGARGYHGTSVRDIAVAAGVSAGTIYNHFESKQDLLAVIMNRGMDVLITACEEALDEAGADPVDRLDALVGMHVRIHAASPVESHVGNSELRSLDPVRLAAVVAKRDVQQRMFRRVIAAGVRTGVFVTEDVAMTTRYVVTACTAIATWYRPDGPADVDELVRQYQALTRHTVGYKECE